MRSIYKRFRRHWAAIAIAMLALGLVLWVCRDDNSLGLPNAALTIVGISGLFFAYWRCYTADENRKQEQYRIASELLGMKDRPFAASVAGAATLADLMRDDPVQYEDRVMRMFEAFLEFPPVFGGELQGMEDKHLRGHVDYRSRDTVVIVEAMNARARESRLQKRAELRSSAPFRVTGCGLIAANPKHEDHLNWIRADGTPPTY